MWRRCRPARAWPSLCGTWVDRKRSDDFGGTITRTRKVNNSLMYIGTLEWVTWMHYCDVTWTSWCLKSPVNWVQVQQFVQDNNNENIKNPALLAFCEENPTVISRPPTFPSQRASIAGSVSVSSEYSFTGNNRDSYDSSLFENYIKK